MPGIIPTFIFIDRGQGSWTTQQYQNLANLYAKYGKPTDYIDAFGIPVAAPRISTVMDTTIPSFVKRMANYNSYIDSNNDLPTMSALGYRAQIFDYEPGLTPLDQMPVGKINCIVGIANGKGPFSFSFNIGNYTGANLTPSATTCYLTKVTNLVPGNVFSHIAANVTTVSGNIAGAVYDDQNGVPTNRLGTVTSGAAGAIGTISISGQDAGITYGSPSPIACFNTGTAGTQQIIVFKLPYTTSGTLSGAALGTVSIGITTSVSQGSTPTNTWQGYLTAGTIGGGGTTTVSGAGTAWTVQHSGGTMTCTGVTTGIYYLTVTLTLPTSATLVPSVAGIQYLDLTSNVTIPDGTGTATAGVVWVAIEVDNTTVRLGSQTGVSNVAYTQVTGTYPTFPSTLSASTSTQPLWVEVWDHKIGTGSSAVSYNNFFFYDTPFHNQTTLSQAGIDNWTVPATISGQDRTNMSENVTGYVFQGQDSVNTPATLLSQWNTAVTQITAGNPQASIVCEMSTVQSTAAQMITAWDTLQNSFRPPDGIHVFYSTSSSVNGGGDGDIAAMDSLFAHILATSGAVGGSPSSSHSTWRSYNARLTEAYQEALQQQLITLWEQYRQERQS